MIKRNIQIDITPLCVEVSTFDFEYIIQAALAHEDEFFKKLFESFTNVTKEFDKEAAKS